MHRPVRSLCVFVGGDKRKNNPLNVSLCEYPHKVCLEDDEPFVYSLTKDLISMMDLTAENINRSK